MDQQQLIKVMLEEKFTICIVDSEGLEMCKLTYFFDENSGMEIQRGNNVKTRYQLKGLTFDMSDEYEAKHEMFK